MKNYKSSVAVCSYCALMICIISCSYLYSFPNQRKPAFSVPTGREEYHQHFQFGALSWATFSDHKLNKTFLFLSAYYDNRTAVPGRPAVAIITYALEFVSKPNLTCVFVYSNGTKKCLRRIAMQEILNCFFDPLDDHKPKPKKRMSQLLLCPVEDGDVPMAVQLSSTADCEEGNLSGQILVENYRKQHQSHMKEIGVCLQGSLRQGGIADPDILMHDLDNFIRMCQFLGAEFITMYASPDEVHEKVTRYLLTNYSHIVNLIQWKVFESHDYHGQNGVVHDCIYRHMYEANYLVFIDLDEMIIPFKQLNWPEMLNELEKKRKDGYAGYSFINKFYVDSKFDYPDLRKCAEIGVESAYLTHVDESQCRYNHADRSKYIVIPKLVVHAAVHSLCKVVTKDQLFPVDSGFAVSAHYRKQMDLKRCEGSKTVRKYGLLKHLINKYVAAICNSNPP